MRRGITLVGIAVAVTALAAAAAQADGGAGTTTTTTTTSTTTTSSTTTTTPTTYTPLSATVLPQSCVGAGIAAIRKPGHKTVAVGSPATALGPSDYPDPNPILTFDFASARGSRCTNESVTLTNVSLFGGAVTATTVAATNGTGTVTGLAISGAPVTATVGQTVAVGDWGLVEVGAAAGRVSAPLALRLLRAHALLPAGTTILLGFAAVRSVVAAKPAPTPPRVVHQPKHHKRNGVRQPLNQTPGLGFRTRHYVFPVDTGASYIDTYGANRNDIYDGWHHGDDLFAPLGTPVLAVANGTLSPIGWDSLGGWRLWLTDTKGNSFYYAHLAGYSRRILHHRRVTAGQVIGFLGRTGDAFTTTPHLHFEIHPHQLVRLGYDGAVDPTRYLNSWRVVKVPASQIPPAARLRAPAGTPRQEAAVVWQELLTARHLMPNGEPVVALPAGIRRPLPNTRRFDVSAVRLASAARLSSQRGPSALPGPWLSVALGLALAVLAATGSLAVLRRRRRPE